MRQPRTAQQKLLRKLNETERPSTSFVAVAGLSRQIKAQKENILPLQSTASTSLLQKANPSPYLNNLRSINHMGYNAVPVKQIIQQTLLPTRSINIGNANVAGTSFRFHPTGIVNPANAENIPIKNTLFQQPQTTFQVDAMPSRSAQPAGIGTANRQSYVAPAFVVKSNSVQAPHIGSLTSIPIHKTTTTREPFISRSRQWCNNHKL
jgi:hypothetical protein